MSSKKKRLVVLGKGTAGAQAILHFSRYMSSIADIEWHYDPNIAALSVGEGSTLNLPRNLFNTIGFSHNNLKDVDGTFKGGIAKKNWGKTGEWFFHDFVPPESGYHFNAVKLQNYIFDKFKDKVKIVEGNTTSDKIDADFIMDCSGKPANFKKFHIPKYIPVNSVHVNQCFWDHPRFQHTLTYARPYGWIFGIPLQNRCSIGYLYNNTINTLDEVKEDILVAIKELDLEPSTTTNSFTFGNYIKKVNFEGRIAYNGTASFFLEPMEATSIYVMDSIQRSAFDLWMGNTSIEQANYKYLKGLTEIESMIMMHYYAGSIFDTPFWTFAKQKGLECMQELKHDKVFINMFNNIKNMPNNFSCNFQPWTADGWASWWAGGLLQNLNGLNIKEDIEKFIS